MTPETNQILSACEKGLSDRAVAEQLGATYQRVRYLRRKHCGKRAPGPKPGGRRSVGSASRALAILRDLRDRPTATYYAIARDHGVSREYVSDIAAQARRTGLLGEKLPTNV